MSNASQPAPPPLGDAHNFGRRVELRGDRVYKPRTVVWERLLLGADSPLRRRLDEAAVARDLMGENAAAHCDIAWLDGEAAGLAIWFPVYASFRAQRGLYIEDLYVRPAFRGRGLGRALLTHLAREAGAGWINGRCWTGMRRRSGFTSASGRGRWRAGSPMRWRARQ